MNILRCANVEEKASKWRYCTIVRFSELNRRVEQRVMMQMLFHMITNFLIKQPISHYNREYNQESELQCRYHTKRKTLTKTILYITYVLIGTFTFLFSSKSHHESNGNGSGKCPHSSHRLQRRRRGVRNTCQGITKATSTPSIPSITMAKLALLQGSNFQLIKFAIKIEMTLCDKMLMAIWE